MSATGRFGIEIELNSLDSRDFVKNPLGKGERPEGMERVSSVLRGIDVDCEVHDWRYNHDPKVWSCKPDNSCGMELCSPVMGMEEIDSMVAVMDALAGDDSLKTDSRCAFHAHLELSTTACDSSLGSILAWWIKCEHVFMDFAHPSRKNNRYCRPIGITDIVDSEDVVSSEILFKKLSSKYLSLNTFHIFNRRRASIEFRIAEGTKDSEFARAWIEILVCFAERAEAAGLPGDYLWMHPREVLEFLDLDRGLQEKFLERLVSNCRADASEFFSASTRIHALEVYSEMLAACRQTFQYCPF